MNKIAKERIAEVSRSWLALSRDVSRWLMLEFALAAERWQSGRMRRTRNPVYVQTYRRFESDPLRQSLVDQELSCGIAEPAPIA